MSVSIPLGGGAPPPAPAIQETAPVTPFTEDEQLGELALQRKAIQDRRVGIGDLRVDPGGLQIPKTASDAVPAEGLQIPIQP